MGDLGYVAGQMSVTLGSQAIVAVGLGFGPEDYAQRAAQRAALAFATLIRVEVRRGDDWHLVVESPAHLLLSVSQLLNPVIDATDFRATFKIGSHNWIGQRQKRPTWHSAPFVLLYNEGGLAMVVPCQRWRSGRSGMSDPRGSKET